MSGDWVNKLKRKVLEEGGTWTGKRAMEYLHSIGFECTIERARVCMQKIARQESSRVRVAEGRRWIWEVYGEAGESAHEALVELLRGSKGGVGIEGEVGIKGEVGVTPEEWAAHMEEIRARAAQGG